MMDVVFDLTILVWYFHVVFHSYVHSFLNLLWFVRNSL